jgi:hypothetical protein
MLSLPPSTRIYVATTATDMRRGFDGLYALVRDVLALDPYSGHLFVFRNKAGNRLLQATGAGAIHIQVANRANSPGDDCQRPPVDFARHRSGLGWAIAAVRTSGQCGALSAIDNSGPLAR